MPQNIFITGATGKIGRFLLKGLLEKEYNITLLCRKEIGEFCNTRIKFVLGDILDPGSYGSGLNRVDTVLHMAAITHTNRISKYYEINSEATLKLIKVCKDYGVKRFIFISSRAISEEGGPYSKSKLLAEMYVQKSGLDWIIMRIAEVYGISGKTGIDMVLKNIERYPFVPIVGKGEYKIAPVYIGDVVSSIITVLGMKDKKNKIYNIAGPESFTYNQFINHLLVLKQLKRIKVHIPVFILKILAKILSLISKDDLVVMDQIPRLLCEKIDDTSLAELELGYKPARLKDMITAGIPFC